MGRKGRREGDFYCDCNRYLTIKRRSRQRQRPSLAVCPSFERGEERDLTLTLVSSADMQLFDMDMWTKDDTRSDTSIEIPEILTGTAWITMVFGSLWLQNM